MLRPKLFEALKFIYTKTLQDFGLSGSLGLRIFETVKFEGCRDWDWPRLVKNFWDQDFFESLADLWIRVGKGEIYVFKLWHLGQTGGMTPGRDLGRLNFKFALIYFVSTQLGQGINPKYVKTFYCLFPVSLSHLYRKTC